MAVSQRRSWWQRAHGLALRSFPREFRDRWGDDMRLAFIDRVNDSRRSLGRTPLGLIAHELTTTISAGLRERFHSSTPVLAMVHAQDIRYAARLLMRSPGFTLLTVLVLSGGLAISTFTFSFLYTGMLRSLPLSEGDRIVRLMRIQGTGQRGIDVADLAALRAATTTLRDLGAYTGGEVLLGHADDRRVASATVTDPVMFKVTRTPALLGRALVPSDAEAGAEPVMVLSYRMWERGFNADRSAVDSQIEVNGVRTRIVGVMPEGFGFPVVQDAWLPLPPPTGSVVPGKENISIFARLAPDVSHDEASAEVSGLIRRALTARDDSTLAAFGGVAVESFPEAQMGEGRLLVFTFLNLLAGLILLLAIVNVTTLLTARANERVRETAVRLALGASTGRLVMQGMWEGIMLCVAGGVIGTAGAAWGLNTITQWTQLNMPDNLAFWWVWRLDHVTLISAGAFVTVAIAVLGAVVSLRAMRTNVREVLQDGSARAGSRREGRLARLLVATQVAAVTILMFVGVLSGVLARRIVNLDPGYDASKLLQVYVAPSPERFASPDARDGAFRTTLEQLSDRESLDGVLLRKKLAPRGDAGAFEIRGGATREYPQANILATLGDMGTLGVTVVQGRGLTASDNRGQQSVVVVSRALAARQWPGRSPIGQMIRLDVVGDTTQWRTIVGVLSDLPYGNLLTRDRSADAVYLPLLQAGAPDADVIVRYRTSEIAGRQALYDAFRAIDPQQIPESVYRVSEVIYKSGLMATGLTKLFGGCFVFALLLAVAGTYGLMSRSIGLRTREIGVRRALGASDKAATRMLLTQGARQLSVGTLAAAPIIATIGAVAAHYLPLGGALTAFVGVAVSAAITGVVLAATWLPTKKVLSVPLRDALWRE
jgi:predicted permease